MPQAFFITGNQHKADEIARLLADVDVATRKLDLSAAAAALGPADLAESARRKVLVANGKLAEPCFVEGTALEIEGGPSFTGAQFKKKLLAMGELAFCQTYGGRRTRARVAVAYTADGDPERVAIFEGEIEGTLLVQPRGEGGYGWDRAFLPEGYERTLGEMAGNKCFLNMRHRPYLELSDLLRGRSFGGTFEAHITVSAPDTEALDRFRAFCAEANVKCIFIELSRGDEPFQPMTASYHHGDLRKAREEVQELSRVLAARGFDVTRLKIEAVGTNRDIPAADEEARRFPSNYFEYHVKATLPPGADLGPLREKCAAHGAHLSRNARRTRPDGASECFVTLRVPSLGRASAEARFAALLRGLGDTGFSLSHRIREYTVYDSNIGLDRGWLPS